MRVLAMWLMAFSFIAGTTAMASEGEDKDTTPKTEASAPAGKSAEPAKAATPAAASSALEAEMQQLRDLLESQAKQLQTQNDQLKEQQQRMQALEEQLRATAARRENFSADAGAPENASSLVHAPSTPAGTGVAGGNAPPAQDQDKKPEETGPASIKYKGITITPGGFVAAETVYRTRAVSGDINTPFTGIPYPGNALSRVSENNFTARQSRLSLLGESKVGSAKLTGYYEADWLGTGVTSNNRQSNSYVMRQRIIYGQAAFDSGWSFTGGQQWSLATEDKKGIQNRQEAIPLTIDSQYNVGFTWERQYGFRVVKDFGGKFALGVAIEGPQATIGGRGFSLVTSTTVGTATTTTSGNTFLNAPGAGGGLFNFVDTSGYSVNNSPDIIIKAALDPGWGHYEVFGIVSSFRNRIYPCGVVGTNAKDTAPPAKLTTIACPVDGSTSPSSLGAFDDNRTGGGFGANLRLPFGKKLDFAVQGLGGDGVGRYGSAQLADLTFRPDGTEALIRTAHGLGEVEIHATPKLDIYAYFGAEYAWRAGYQGYNSITVTKTPAIPATLTSPKIPATTTTAFKLNQVGGYGSAFANNTGCSTENPPANQLTPSAGGTCAGDTRLIMEGTLGFWHRFYQGPKGGLRWGLQYSYLVKDGYSGNNNVATSPGVGPKAIDNMLWTSLRYYIP
jgi:hypothetical protein